MSTTQSVLTPIRVPLVILRRILDVHAEMQELTALIDSLRQEARRPMRADARRCNEDETERAEGRLEDLQLEEGEALREYYMYTVGALGIDPTRPGDMRQRLEASIRAAAGGGL